MLLAAHLLAPRLAQVAALFRSCPVHVRDHTTVDQPGATRQTLSFTLLGGSTALEIVV
jgi:hypothetical protein